MHAATMLLVKVLEELIISSEELPVKASWPAICKELIKNDLTDVVCIDQGIKINLTAVNPAERES